MLVSRLPIALVLAAGLMTSMLAQSGALRMPAQQDATPAAQPAEAGPAHLGGDLLGDPQIQLIQVASGFSTPVNVTFPPDDSGRMFVVEVGGLIRIVEPDGTVNPTPFLDLSDTLSLRPGQQGLLGLAFHPDFAKNGKLYVDYNNLYANGEITISEFQVDPNDPNVVDKRTERPLLTIEKPYPQHNGGTLRFGQDGYLYISTGDGGWQGDPDDNAQSRFSLLGKILRIDVNGGDSERPYAIPPDNPFAGPGRYDSPYPGQPPAPNGDEKSDKKQRKRDQVGVVSPENRKNRSKVKQEIWAFGFRNPWQFSFDPVTNDFYVADVGADTWEEINFQPADSTAGQNYGWDWLEASHCFPAEIAECPRQQVGVLPVAEYEHGDDGCAVIGLGVYRAKESPELDGIYFNGEYCTGEIRGLQRDENGVWQFQNLLDTALQITGSGQDANHDLYVTAVSGELASEGEGTGSIWKLVAADKVPEGATTVPLGQPRQGEVEVDEEGEPVAAGASSPAPASAEATPEDAAATDTAGAEAAEDVVIGLYDIYFEPDRITIPANTNVRFVFENHGEAPHNFMVNRQDISVDVEPGGTAETIINLPKGDYKFICNVPGHKQVGMNGTLVVK